MRHERVGGRVYVLLSAEQPSEQTTDHTEELIRTLQEQLAAERAAHAEARRLLAAARERIPQIEASASPEPQESPADATEQPGRVEPRPAVESPQEGAQRPPVGGGCSGARRMMGNERDPQEERYERQLGLLRGERISELRRISSEELIEIHDAHIAEAKRSNKLGVRAQWLGRAQRYADELARREAERQGERMEELTESLNDLSQRIVRLTQVGVGVAIVGVILALLTVISGG